MKNLFKLLGLILCIALVAGCTPKATEPPATLPATEKPTATEAPVVVTPAPLTGTFTDPASGMAIQYPDGWTPVSNTGSVGVTALSADWAGIAVFKLVYEDVQAVDADLAAMQEALVGGKDFAKVTPTADQTASVFGQDWAAYTWQGYYTAVSKDYSGLDTVVSYGKNLVEITAYSPTAEWVNYEPTLRAILSSLVKPADDFAYVPPVKTNDWLSFTSSEFALTVAYPPDWQTPIAPWVDQGLWLNSADWMTSVIVWVKDGTDAAAALNDFATTQTVFPTLTVTDGDPITIMGEQYATKMGEGANSMGTAIKCGVTYVPYNGKLLEILWYAGTDGSYWDNGQDAFKGILATLQGVSTYTSDEFKLAVSYPSTWQTPTAPWVDKGLWLNSADWMTSVIVWVKDGTDAAKMLADWGTTQAVFPGATVTDGDPVTIMGTEYPTKHCEGANSMGTAIKCGVTMVPYEGKMLEIVWYAGTDGGYWDAGQQVFPLIITSIKAP
jgi:hypothetical protein